jgi:hypothetical protein
MGSLLNYFSFEFPVCLGHAVAYLLRLGLLGILVLADGAKKVFPS